MLLTPPWSRLTHLALVQDLLECRLEEAVAHLVPEPVLPGQEGERDLVLSVAVPEVGVQSRHRLSRGKVRDGVPRHGVSRGGYQCWCYRDLVLGAGSDVKPLLPHNGHVEVVDQSQLQSLRALVEVRVVE